MIPTIPRKIFSMSTNYHQSAPMHITMMSEKNHHKTSVFGCDDGVDVVVIDDDYDGEMFPPHEIVARKMANSLLLSSSVLEGVGRTLRGRNLRQCADFTIHPHPKIRKFPTLPPNLFIFRPPSDHHHLSAATPVRVDPHHRPTAARTTLPPPLSHLLAALFPLPYLAVYPPRPNWAAVAPPLPPARCLLLATYLPEL
ncbi:hypothetical protein BVRB_7g164670 [Beta vulgaris subsp. vulgaris]|nr:hypothetical protein BVRB_7g164670 [Beta vulgaris subsp. vulgaris]